MAATGILPQAALALPCASRLFLRLEYEQKFCVKLSNIIKSSLLNVNWKASRFLSRSLTITNSATTLPAVIQLIFCGQRESSFIFNKLISNCSLSLGGLTKQQTKTAPYFCFWPNYLKRCIVILRNDWDRLVRSKKTRRVGLLFRQTT